MARHKPKIPDDLMPLEEAAKVWGVSPRTLQNKASRGEIRKYKITQKSKPFFSKADLMAEFVRYG